MAHALAALYPPLATVDVIEAAEKLTLIGWSPHIVVDWLFRSDLDPARLRVVIATLHALHDLGSKYPTQSDYCSTRELTSRHVGIPQATAVRTPQSPAGLRGWSAPTAT